MALRALSCQRCSAMNSSMKYLDTWQMPRRGRLFVGQRWFGVTLFTDQIVVLGKPAFFFPGHKTVVFVFVAVLAVVAADAQRKGKYIYRYRCGAQTWYFMWDFAIRNQG